MTNNISTNLDELIEQEHRRAADRIAKLKRAAAAEQQGDLYNRLAREAADALAAYGQGAARDFFLEGVLALPDDVAEMIRIFVHDEVVLSVPRDHAEDVKQAVISAFESVQLPCVESISVPVLADSAGPEVTWAGCK
ncbi:hypothetical protein [Corynebacterium alimapuense]|uniref:Uncharacterized protein n=1 Tax=Corynebacterium alimapuense TaxID=1576874 RepID=A0A3M8K8R6_9CORY|nr:hypothetical protein [Corynebacterium alimapuense]RNE48858.1 hypothetical protein C5L39_06070 [Corynebacterium alimapuense]